MGIRGQDPQSFIDRASNMSVDQILRGGIGGTILALFALMITGFQTVAALFLEPINIILDIATESATAFFLEPFGLTRFGVISSAEAVLGLEGFGQLFALPIAVAIVLLTLFLVLIFLSFDITSNILPGFIVDNKLLDLVTTTPEEEEEED